MINANETKIAVAINHVLARLPMDYDTYKIKTHIAELRGFADRILAQSADSPPGGNTDARVVAKTR